MKLTSVLSLATAVSRIDNLEFLADVIPKTTTYKQFKEKRAREAAREAAMEKGQRTLNGHTAVENGTGRPSTGPSLLEITANGDGDLPDPISVTYASGNRSTMMVDRTVDVEQQDSEDAEMAD